MEEEALEIMQTPIKESMIVGEKSIAILSDETRNSMDLGVVETFVQGRTLMEGVRASTAATDERKITTQARAAIVVPIVAIGAENDMN